MKIKRKIKNNDFEVNLNKSLHFLSFRPRSEKEVSDFLKKKRVDEATILRIISKLKENKFINDEEFARWWVEQRTKYRPRAWRVIKMELRQKGVSEDIISNFKFQISDDEGMAIELAEKRMPRYRNFKRDDVYQKLGRYLMSKGFNWDTVKRALASTELWRSRD